MMAEYETVSYDVPALRWMRRRLMWRRVRRFLLRDPRRVYSAHFSAMPDRWWSRESRSVARVSLVLMEQARADMRREIVSRMLYG